MNHIKRGLVVWMNLDGKGSEQKGYRPCIVVQNNTGNVFSNTTIVVPLTTKTKLNGNLPTHTLLKKEELGEPFCDSVALTEQIKVVDKTRIVRVGNKLSDLTMDRIDRAILISLGIRIA